MPDYPQYVRDLVKAWAAGDDHAGQVLRFLSSTPEERKAMRREALAADERSRAASSALAHSHPLKQ